MKRNLFTSEAVSIGHPDHVCDRISDSILDACLREDKNARVACETMAKDEFIILSGEISTKANINVEQIVKDTIKQIGYTYTPRVLNLLSKQSPDIAQGVDNGGDCLTKELCLDMQIVKRQNICHLQLLLHKI